MRRTGGFHVLVPLAALALLATACREAVPTAVPSGLQHDRAAPERPFQGVLDLQALGWADPPWPVGYATSLAATLRTLLQANRAGALARPLV